MKAALLILAAWAAFGGAFAFEAGEYVQMAWYWGSGLVLYGCWWYARRQKVR